MLVTRRVSFEFASFLEWPTASFNIARGIAPGAEKHGPILAKGQTQFKTCGLMLAVGQPISLHSRSLGRCPRLR
ncbi:hypothetical protein-putative conserved hypothetical protein [Rhodopirellula baltica SH 1]|uniref:Uncharacterized protein n=1 Tax=Rhodopirellula baltica (strain DSM 10527 / NCIMB 13988 / SH1) TaxID=243090 RepID=Q7UL59_RHOBA|nr:hypothetical protein-putative conserved hypothetical protein [Rhodopirellula baltica SH 1]